MGNDISKMVEVPLESFFQGLKTEVDVYIRLGDGKYVLLVRASEAFDLEQLKRYQLKSITHLYIKKEDYSVFVKRQVSLAGIILDHEQITNKRKSNVITQAAQNVYQEIFDIGVNEQTYQNAKQISQHVTSFIETQERLSKIFESLNAVSDDILKHSIAVGLFSTMIAKEMGWTRKDTLEKLNLGGFLHDIGKKELDPQLLSKPRDQMSREEVRDYETHPYRGMMILNSLTIIPQDVVSIVYEHHENSIGQGFPRRIKDIQIHPLAKVVGLANYFVELTIKSKNNPKPMKSDDALAFIELTMGQPFNKECFEALKTLVFGEKESKSA